ncbi:secondary thiamine-phosphate synthase enzyme YjbQ [Pseudomonadota bacterium]
MQQISNTFTTDTRGPGLYEITREVANWCAQQGMTEGLLTLFIRHTSASLTIQENADPDVCHDLQDFFSRIAPDNGPYRHSDEGPDDMPAHIKTALTQTHLAIPLVRGRLALGTWQGIYIFEHRNHGHRRQVAAHLMGE